MYISIVYKIIRFYGTHFGISRMNIKTANYEKPSQYNLQTSRTLR